MDEEQYQMDKLYVLPGYTLPVCKWIRTVLYFGLTTLMLGEVNQETHNSATSYEGEFEWYDIIPIHPHN